MSPATPYINSSNTRACVGKIQILSAESIARPAGYALPGYQGLSLTVIRNGFEATGYGEGNGQLARDKALSEAIERCVLKEFAHQQGITETSNGWSCHQSASLAIENAIFELIERDVALSTWQSGGPFIQLPEELWPSVLKAWKAGLHSQPEFFDLRILLSETKNGACISALLFNERGNFVAGHATGLLLESAIISATAECFRAAHAAVRFEHFAEVLSLHAGTHENPAEPGAHSLAYAYTVSMPKAIGIVLATSSEILEKWSRHRQSFLDLDLRDFGIMLFPVEGRVVARVKNEKYRQIFWGKDPSCFQKNNPHFVG